MKMESETAQLTLLMVNNFELYQNNFATNLEELFEVSDQAKMKVTKLSLLHPTNLLVKNLQYMIKSEAVKVSDLNVSIGTVEFEVTPK